MSSQIFISYRRDGGDVTAKLICETLKNRGYTVFYDYDALKSGFFDESILHSIEECTDFIIVLPPLALERCYDENDWVRSEIRHAITCRKNIVPVTLDGFEFPKSLPDDIDQLRRYNGIRFMMDYFEAVIDKIEERLSSRPASFDTAKNPHTTDRNFVGKITVRRKIQYGGCAVPISVFVDKRREQKLWIGQSFDLTVSEGTHTLDFKMQTLSSTFTANISPSHPESVLEISMKLKNILWNYIAVEEII